MRQGWNKGLAGIIASAILTFGPSSRADDYMAAAEPNGSFNIEYPSYDTKGCSVGNVYNHVNVMGKKGKDKCIIEGSIDENIPGKIYHLTLGDDDTDKLDVIRRGKEKKEAKVDHNMNMQGNSTFNTDRIFNIPSAKKDHPKSSSRKDFLGDYVKVRFHSEIRLREMFSRNHLDDNKESSIRGDMAAIGRYDSYTNMDILLFDTLIIGGSWGIIGDNIDKFKDSYSRWDFQDSIRFGVYKRLLQWHGSLTYSRIFGSALDFYKGDDKELRLSIGRVPDKSGVYFSEDLVFGKRRYLSPSVSVGNEITAGFFFDNGAGLILSEDTYLINDHVSTPNGNRYKGVKISPTVIPKICFKGDIAAVCGGTEYAFREDSPFDIYLSITAGNF